MARYRINNDGPYAHNVRYAHTWPLAIDRAWREAFTEIEGHALRDTRTGWDAYNATGACRTLSATLATPSASRGRHRPCVGR